MTYRYLTWLSNKNKNSLTVQANNLAQWFCFGH